MNRATWIRAALCAALALPAWACEAGGSSLEERAALERQTEALVAEILPQVASLNGFDEFHPVRVEAKTKEELRAALPSQVRAIYGPDLLRWRGRVLAELGFWPRGYDLEDGMMNVLIEVMGGGYDPQRHTFYTLLDLPAAMKDPASQRIVVAHELTHALQDQRGDMQAHLRRSALDSDYEDVYGCIIEGMAYVTMMAVAAHVPLSEAPDPAPMLVTARQSMEAGGGFPVFAAAPRPLQEALFGRAIQGIRFCQAWLRDHPDGRLVALLDSLPSSGEQVLHYDKYVAGDRPVSFDLAGLDTGLPGDWRPCYEHVLGEFEIRMLADEHEVTRASAEAIGAGWDGCRFRAYEDGDGGLAILGQSAWDSDEDAREFADGMSRILATCREAEDYSFQARGNLVSFVVGVPDAEAREATLGAISRCKASS